MSKILILGAWMLVTLTAEVQDAKKLDQTEPTKKTEDSRRAKVSVYKKSKMSFPQKNEKKTSKEMLDTQK